MALWYALICVTDQFMPNGKLDYPAGAVKSFGTVLSGDDEQLAAKGIRAVALGEYPDSGPDFHIERFDLIQERMVPYSVPKDAADILLDKPTWLAADIEAALRIILRGGKT